jgi:aldehyde:ferredoxin oxidoreductase
MLTEIFVNLDENNIETETFEDSPIYGKALAVDRLTSSDNPEEVVYLTGYTPLETAGLGFGGKLNVYGVSLLGKNLQGSRSGGMINSYLRKHGILGLKISGKTHQPKVLYINQDGKTSLKLLSEYGDNISGVYQFADAIYKNHGNNLALALTDPATTGFNYNAIVCNTKKGEHPNRAAGRGTNIFGRNGLVGVVAEPSSEAKHTLQYDKKAVAELLRIIKKTKANITLLGSADPKRPLLGGTYGSAAAFRYDFGHGLTNLFRSANVPAEVLDGLLPDNIVKRQIQLAEQNQVDITRYQCLTGCPNKCVEMIVLENPTPHTKTGKAGEWETYMGMVNLGVFKDAVEMTSKAIEHSNDVAYDHIEGLVALAALALVTEMKEDTGVRYGDAESILSAMDQARDGKTELGQLIRMGTAEIERHYGIKRHFTVGGHALPFHNGRSMLQTGIGLSWTYGRHGESCAGPGRHNFLGNPYDPADRNLDPEVHVQNTIHSMIMYGAMDEMGLCFFMGPSVDSLTINAMILNQMGIKSDVREMIQKSARNIHKIHAFNKERGVTIQPLPDVFYEIPTHGNAMKAEEAAAFSIPFHKIRDFGARVLSDVADGTETVPDNVLKESQMFF